MAAEEEGWQLCDWQVGLARSLASRLTELELLIDLGLCGDLGLEGC